VVVDRIRTRFLIQSFISNFFGWDNSFLLTFRIILTNPAQVIGEYLDGVRKRYMPPIVFVSFGVALATIVYNLNSEEYLSLANSFGEAQFQIIKDRYEAGNMSEEQYQLQLENYQNSANIQSNALRYFNLISFLSLPIYAFVSLLVFGRKFTYGEHLVINCYLQGLSFFGGILFFLGGVYFWTPLIYIQLFFIIPFYLWTYAKLLNFGFGKALLKFLLFLAVMLGISIVFVIVIAIFIAIEQFGLL
jgi:hypothetical protein